MANSIRRKLTKSYIALAVTPLLMVGLILGWKSYTVQKKQALGLQGEVSKRIASEIINFFHEMETSLRVIGNIQDLLHLGALPKTGH